MYYRWIVMLCLAALALSGCASAPAGPGAGTQPPAPAVPEESETPDPREVPTELPVMTGIPNPSDPVSNSEPTPSGERSPLDPLPGEKNMERGSIFISSGDVLVMESYPVQVVVSVLGDLPTPCHHLRAQVSPPDAQNRIQVELYTLVDPAEMCIQVLKSFETRIPLGSFPSGTYSVWLNGEQIGEFTS